MTANRRNSVRQSGKRRQRGRKRSRRRRRNRIMPVLLGFIFIIVVLGIVAASIVIQKYSPSKEKADLQKYYGLENDTDVAVILQNEKSELHGKIIDGTVYLNFDTVQDYLNSRFYWDANENVLLYALPDNLVSVPVGSSDYTIGKDKYSTDYAIVKAEGNVTYIAIDFVQEYTDFMYTFYEDPNRIQIMYQWKEEQVVTLKDDEAVRYQAGIKSNVLTEGVKNQKLFVLETEEQIEDWTKVRTEDGFIGYVRNKKLGAVGTEQIVSDRNFTEPVYKNISKDYTINMAWHNVTTKAANDSVLSTIASTKGLTTISPTWFTIKDNNGNLESIASAEYVNYAHQNGIEVWGVVDNFKSDVSTFEVLSYTSKRENLINQLIAQAIQYDLDGINVDFEELSVETGVHFIQFVRELSIKCRSNQIVLSVDNYVPRSYSAHYFREEQGIVADYVIIMGYDEHFAGSEKSGSVASIGYVRDGIEQTLQEVPAEKVINAVPFYTRIWKETPKTEAEIAEEDDNEVGAEFIPYKLSSEAQGMQATENVIIANGATPEWDETTGQYYVEYQKDGITYKIWMEEERSIEEKAKLLKEYNLAGIAAWKLGLEKASIWDVILKYVN